ncbi:MAG: hypothetical protein GY754_10970 [bacterium]|nr:hypothetical protein [bacterium]
MPKEDFKESFFAVANFITKSKLTNSGRELLSHFFNNADGLDSKSRAIGALERYYGEELPPQEELSNKGKKLFETMIEEADLWDSED